METKQIAMESPTLGLVPLEGWQVIKVSGPDAKSFLSGLLTNEVKKLQPGDNNSALILTAKGRIQREVQVMSLPDGLYLLAAPGEGQAVCEFLDFYHIMEDLTIALEGEEESAMTPLLLVGSALPAWSEANGPQAWPDEGKGAAFSAPWGAPEGTDAAQSELWCSRTARLHGLPAAFLWLPSSQREAAMAALVEAGFSTLDEASWSSQSAWHGWLPAAQIYADLLVHEAGLHESHVSYTKGCFVGQEVVARTQHRGRPTKGVFLLQPSEADTALAKDEELTDDEGKSLGKVLGACDLPTGEKAYHALIKLKAVEEETPLFAQGKIPLAQVVFDENPAASS